MKTPLFFDWMMCCVSVAVTIVIAVSGGSWETAMLAGDTLLLMEPLGDESRSMSLWWCAASCLLMTAGSVIRIRPPFILIAADVSLLTYSFCRSSQRFVHPNELFRSEMVWQALEHEGRLVKTATVILMSLVVITCPWHVVSMTCSAASSVIVIWSMLASRTLVVGRRRETEIRNLSTGRLAPPPTDRTPAGDAGMAELYARIIRIVEEDRPYLDSEFSLESLATEAYSNRSYVSRTINVMSGRNFRQFINYYRIEHAAALIREDRHAKMVDVAVLSGFHSIASFNMAFKLYMKETPTEYSQRVSSHLL